MRNVRVYLASLKRLACHGVRVVAGVSQNNEADISLLSGSLLWGDA